MRTRLLAGALLLATAIAADASVLCRTRKGAIMVRDLCKKHETALDGAALAGLGAQGSAGTHGAQIRVADVNGKDVGALNQQDDVDFGDVVVTTTLGTDVVPLVVDRAGFVQTPSQPRSFLTADCTGDAYALTGPQAPPIPFAAVEADGFTVTYARQADAATHLAYYRSGQVSAVDANHAIDTCHNGLPAGTVTSDPFTCPAPNANLTCVDCCREITDLGQFLPAAATPIRTFDLRTLALTPPFHLERR